MGSAKDDYTIALKYSRNFKNRSLNETKVVYETIQKAVTRARRKKRSKISDDALKFLTEVYSPFLKKCAGKHYKYVENRMSYEDVLQEAHIIFYTLLYRYDKNLASFSYFINILLPQHMYVWVEKVCLDKDISVDVSTLEESVPTAFSDAHKIYTYFDGKILEEEYIEFILARSKKSSRSTTVREVCLKIFLGSTTCSGLAKELGISYHAVYEIQKKIQRELHYFFNDNQFSECYMTSTGLKSEGFTYKY